MIDRASSVPLNLREGGSVLERGAAVPTELQHDRFVATPLTVATAALDYASYMASPDVIRVHSDGRWPTEGFTLDDDLELVARHQVDHENRRAFTFVLLTPSRTEALGCVYVNPLREYPDGREQTPCCSTPSPRHQRWSPSGSVTTSTRTGWPTWSCTP
jgi:hypothetical protein